MRYLRPWLARVAVPSAAFWAAVLFVPAPAAALEVDCTRPQTQWSTTRPPVNLTHIFCGEINSRGRPVGFHARPDGRDPPSARLLEVIDGPNARGVYIAEVAVRGPALGRPAAGAKVSTFFPDALSPRQVLDAILAALRDAEGQRAERQRPEGQRGGKWQGDSGRGFRVEGWWLPDGRRINTAWPIYLPAAAAARAGTRRR